MTSELETHEDKWTELSKTNLTRVIYRKKYRLETPDDGEIFLESMEDVRHYLDLYYGDQ